MTARSPRTTSSRIPWRPWLRAIHRDAGYLVVGLTVVYALSGIAVNHIADWDPNFVQIERSHQLEAPIAGDDRAATERVLAALGIDEIPKEIYRATEAELEVTLDHRTLHVDLQSGRVQEEGQKPRFLLRAANGLHLNRGKKAWSYVADGYAMLLLYLAISGMFMLPGRRGILGRGGLFVLVGVMTPVLYVVLSGGP